MKKLLLVVVFAAATALGIWFGMHGGSSRTSSAAVTALLPRETLAFLHVPDLNRSRGQWKETDLYKLWREAAVQDFLQKPLAQAPAAAGFQKLNEIEPLEIKDAFLAVTFWKEKQLRVIGGFRFKGKAEDAEKIIGQWRRTPSEVLEYEGHRLEVVKEGDMILATAYAGDWLFAGNEVTELKALLDRADGGTKDSAQTLTAEENFLAAARHMPATYAVRGYARVDLYRALAASPGEADMKGDLAILEQVRAVSAAASFDKNRIRSLLFVAMPKLEQAGELTRSSLALTTRDTFLYFASLLHWPSHLPDAPAAAPPGIAAFPQQFATALRASGVTMETWKAAFGAELGALGEWPANSRLPWFHAILPVKDHARASELLQKISSALPAENPWTKTEQDGVQYFSQPPLNPMLPLAPTVALSRERLILGHDRVALEALVRRSGAKSSELAASDAFETAEELVPNATHSFAYLDCPLLYTRLDAALRPMLVMAAAFVPNIAQTVDLGKLPAPEVITKHLSPIVMSQRYETDGYVTESAGP